MPNDRIAATDEILQVLYWLRGEDLAQEVTPAELAQWIGLDTAQIETLLTHLLESKLVERVSSEATKSENVTRFRLTSSGVHEGGRRFADEFADLTKPGHYECGDPNCECQRTGNPADCVHQH